MYGLCQQMGVIEFVFGPPEQTTVEIKNMRCNTVDPQELYNANRVSVDLVSEHTILSRRNKLSAVQSGVYRAANN